MAGFHRPPSRSVEGGAAILQRAQEYGMENAEGKERLEDIPSRLGTTQYPAVRSEKDTMPLADHVRRSRPDQGGAYRPHLSAYPQSASMGAARFGTCHPNGARGRVQQKSG